MATINGTSGNDTLNGTDDADLISGFDGDDFIQGHSGRDEIRGGEGNDILAGGTLTITWGSTTDLLDGGGGNDRLYGTGAAQLVGGTGDDAYYVFDRGSSTGDRVFEQEGEGIDSVFADGSYTLREGAEVEFLYLSGPIRSYRLTLTGNSFDQTLIGSAGPDHLNGAGGDDTIYSSGGNDIIDGGSGNDILHTSGTAYTILRGGSGSDTFHVNISDAVQESAGQGSDRIFTANGYHLDEGTEVEVLEAIATSSIRLSGNSGDNILRGNAGANMLAGRAGTDFVYGGGGDDILDGGTGSDLLEGGAGVDFFAFTTAIGSNNTDQVTDFLVGTDKIVLSRDVFTTLAEGALPAEAFRSGTFSHDTDDRILYDPATGALSYDADGNGSGGAIRFATLQPGLALSASDFLVVRGTQIANNSDAPRNLTGTGDRDVLLGGGSDDTIDGGDGPDVLIGGNGNDRLIGGGRYPSLGFSDKLYGEDGDDILDGGEGADRMYGGRGDDTFYVDDAGSSGELGNNVGDSIYESPGEGWDTLYTSVQFTLSDSVEIEVIYSSATAMVVGNNFANVMTGRSLSGGGGNDRLFGIGASGLNGDLGDDVLVGGSGDDVMRGGGGNDTFYVNNSGDLVFELIGEGNDRVATPISYTLPTGSEVETLEVLHMSGTEAINLTGSDTANTIIGNAGANKLDGRAGADVLVGGAGDDFLIGGTGADTMYGGHGNDTYYVDDIGDVVHELSGQGYDRIATLVSFTLAAGSSIEMLEATNSTSTNAMDLTGNGLDNIIAGNDGVNVISGGDGNDTLGGYGGADTLTGGAGDDVLIGGLGNDTMIGGEGSDKYYVTDTGDVIVEGAHPGEDVVASSVSYTLAEGVDVERLEPITLTGTDALNLTGNEFGNYVVGNNGQNVLNGGRGADVLEGLGGQDYFVFTTALGNGNVDTITDFLSSYDRILLEDSIFTGLTPGGLFAGQFTTGSQAQDADDRIIYNPATGAILFDPDGVGGAAAIHFATIGKGLNITANDFLVI